MDDVNHRRTETDSQAHPAARRSAVPSRRLVTVCAVLLGAVLCALSLVVGCSDRGPSYDRELITMVVAAPTP